MSCRRAASLISALIDGELCGNEALRVRDHLERCECCRREYESLLQTKRLLSSLKPVEPRPEFEREIVIRVRQACHEPEWRRRIGAWWATTDAGTRVRAAALLAAFSLIVLALSIRFTITSSSTLPPRASTGTLANADALPLPEQDIAFAHETFDRPQPVSYLPSPAPQVKGEGARLQPLQPWQTYRPVSSAP